MSRCEPMPAIANRRAQKLKFPASTPPFAFPLFRAFLLLASETRFVSGAAHGISVHSPSALLPSILPEEDHPMNLPRKAGSGPSGRSAASCLFAP